MTKKATFLGGLFRFWGVGFKRPLKWTITAGVQFVLPFARVKGDLSPVAKEAVHGC
ncbi:hypothetical protein SAMN05444515_1142 [Ectothiorhodospira marina]|uniref:Uncharacterized protein n=1 Tax=Ectothiorhodospira marina TaxID=1396821 RepID=A0A1H7PES0_9GAMM|nr:hypothetical protein SAMN05444515_1142 [Ectothiorhodospira marina]